MSQPIHYNFKSEILPIVIIILSFILGSYFYIHFPDRVVSHWNFQGQPNGYSGKFMGAFGLPFLILFVYALFSLLPWLDPRSNHYQSFASVFFLFRTLILTALLTILIVVGLNNLGYNIPINLAIPAIIGLLLIFIGTFMPKLKSNWFMGVRTPWTLSSENVWNKTNHFAGRAMAIFGLLIIISPFLAKTWAISVFVCGALFLVLGSVLYSYVLYTQEQNIAKSKMSS